MRVPSLAVRYTLAWLALASIAIGQEPRSPAPSSREDLFDQVVEIIENRFFDPKLRGVDWRQISRRFRSQVLETNDREEFSDIVNRMLATLGTSHTRYYTPLAPDYYQILGVFESGGSYAEELDAVRAGLPHQTIGYVGIGIATSEVEKRTFVESVYDGFAAAKAGLRVGDEIISVNDVPFHPIQSFANREKENVRLLIRRQPDGPATSISVTPQFLTASTMFEEAMTRSARIIERNGRKVAYVHIWSYSGKQYQELLEDLLSGGKLKQADALLLDLRDGWGGASPSYLTMFDRRIPTLSMTLRDGSTRVFDRQWRKPAALLINERVRSGKEAFAWGFRKMGIGPIVGTRTAGAVVAGGLQFLPDHSVIYLAVADVTVDGERLEGIGVEPTVAVDRPIPYSAGRDPQLQTGVEELGQRLSDR